MKAKRSMHDSDSSLDFDEQIEVKNPGIENKADCQICDALNDMPTEKHEASPEKISSAKSD